MAAEDYSIRINVDSTSAERAQRDMHNLSGGVSNAERAMRSMNGTSNDGARSLTSLGNAAKFAAMSIATISFGKAVQEIASFETKMLQLTALTGASSKQMKALEIQARELGATTAFSAQQAAEGMGVLASAGLKTNEIMKATPQILQLASAGAMELAKAAEISIAAMHGMGLELKDLGHINDVLVKAANDYTINVEQLGHAFGETAVVAKNYGVSLEAVASSLGILKESGMAAGSIGDALKTMFGALVNDTKGNQEVLGRYTVGLDKHKMTYKDLSVETLGYTKVLQNLKDAQIGATDMTKLFGESASTAAMGLSQHIDKIKENETAYKSLNGVAEKQTEILNKGLKKAWDSLLGALGEAAQQFGEVGTKIDDTGKSTGSLKTQLTDLIKAATGVISIYEGLGDKFAESNKLTKEQYQNLKDVAGALHSFGGAVGGVVVLTGAIYALRVAQLAFNAAAAMNPYIAGAMVFAGTIGHVNSKINEGQQKSAELVKQSTTVEEANLKVKQQIAKVAGIRAQDKNTIDKNLLERENATLNFLVDQRKILEKKAEIIPDGIDGDFINTKIETHSKSLDANAESSSKAGAAHNGLSDAQKELNKQQDNYNRLVEKFKGEDAFEKYNKEMAELQSVQKSLEPEVFAANQKRIAEEFQKSTVDLNAYNNELERHKQYIDNVGDYNSTIDELTRNKQRGAISQSEYGLGVAKANAGLMNDASAAYPDAKIAKISPEKAGEVIDAKNIDESAKALEKLTKQQDDAIAKFNEIGNSGKMAFDGLLGGISAVASAFGSLSDELSNLNKQKTSEAESYKKFMDDATNSESDKAKESIKHKEYESALNDKTFKAEISGAMSIAGATAKMFNQKSVAARAFHGIEMGLAVVSMAMSAKKMIVDVAAGAAAMFGQSGWAGFAGVAAMMAVMAGLGVAMTGGTKTSGSIQESTKTTGTVLGDSLKQSESVKNITDVLKDIDAHQFPELKNITSAVKDLNTAQSNMLTNMFRGGGIKLSTVDTRSIIGGLGSAMLNTLAFGIGGFLFGKTTKSVVGGGVNIAEQTLGSIDESGKILGNVSTDIQTKTKSLFSTSIKISQVLTALDDSISSGMGKIFSSIRKTVLSYWEYLGLDIAKGVEKLSTYKIPAASIKTFGLKDDEIQKAFDSYTSLSLDQIMEYMLGGFAKQFQQLGETLTETLNRVTTSASSVRNSFKYLGADMGKTDENLVIFSDRMITAFGGLKNLITTIDGIVNKYVSKETKAAVDLSSAKTFLSTDNRAALASAGITAEMLAPVDDLIAKIDSGMTVSAAEMRTIGDNLGKAAEGSNLSAKALSDSSNLYKSTVATGFKEQAFTHTSPLITKAEKGDIDTLVKALPSIWGDLTYATTTAQAKEIAGIYWDNLKGYGSVSNMFAKNDVVEEAGFAGLKSLGISVETLKEFNDAANLYESGVGASTDVIAGFLMVIDGLKSPFDNLNEVTAKQTSIQEELMVKITAATMTTKRAHDVALAILPTTIATGIDPLVVEAHEKWRLTLSSDEQALYGVTKAGDINVKSMQALSYSMDETATSFKKLADASKFMIDFGTSINKWVANMRATQLGTPTTQIEAAGKSFANQLLKAQGVGSSAEQKREALSGITGFADTYIASIKSYFGTGEKANTMIEQVVTDIQELDKAIPIEQLQLGVLQDIKDGVYKLPVSLSAASQTTYDLLIAQIAKDNAVFKEKPNVANTMKLDADSKLALSIVNAATSGASIAFVDKFISSFGGDTGLIQQVSLMFDKDDVSASATALKLDDLFSGISITFAKLTGGEGGKTSYDLLKESLADDPIKPSVDVSGAEKTLTGFQDGALAAYNGIKVDKTLSIGGADTAVTALGKEGDLKTPYGLTLDFSKLDTTKKIKVDGVTDAVTSLELLTQSYTDMAAAKKLAFAEEAAGIAQIAADKLAAQNAAKVVPISPSINWETLPVGGLSTTVNASPVGWAANAPGMQAQIMNNDAIKAIEAQNAANDARNNAALAAAPQMQSWAGANGTVMATNLTDALVMLEKLAPPQYNARAETLAQNSLSKFAKGGIANTASIFGEAGAEAAVPLPDGRSIPVTLNRPAANDSSVDMSETIAELKAQNQKLEQVVNTLMAGFKELRDTGNRQVDSIDDLRTETRLKARG